MIRFALLLAAVGILPAEEPLRLVLPTDNRAIFGDKPEEFYMYVPRVFEGQESSPWTAGQYGFVRTLRRTEKDGIIAVQFHEGIDIKPTKRDRNNNPLDEIRAIDKGEVVYTNKNAGASNYGKYVVIRHDWDCGPFYSLYAHLSRIDVSAGDKLNAGQPFAVMGFTGRGINRTRAHLHLELCMLATENIDEWFGASNPHGLYHGYNLIGIDIASLLIACEGTRKVTLPEFQKGAQPYFKVAVPRKGEQLEIVTRYPWLAKGDLSKPSPSWEIAFTDSGIPLSIAPSGRKVTKPTVTFVRTTRSRHEYYTSSRLVGAGRKASLSDNGRRFIRLFTIGKPKPKPPTAE